jgi:hypothetical protein
MRLVLALVALATALVLVGGVGWIACASFEADRPRIVFQYVLMGAIGVTLLSLGTALVVGLWHLYLYLFTDKKPLSLFATTSKRDDAN